MKSQKLPKYRRKTQNQNSFEPLRPVDNETSGLIEIRDGYPDTISFWIEAYFGYEVTTSVSSQKVQRRDLTMFRDFLLSWPSDSNGTISYAKLFPIKLSQWPQTLPIEFLFNVETDLSMHVYAGELGWPLV